MCNTEQSGSPVQGVARKAQIAETRRNVEMITVTIELPETYEVASRGEIASFALGTVPEEKRAAFFRDAALHGIKQALGDSAASATKQINDEIKKGETTIPDGGSVELAIQERTRDLMESKKNGWKSGEWSARREAAVSDPVGKRAFSIVLDWIKRNTVINAAYSAGDKERKAVIRAAVFEKYEEKLREEAKWLMEKEKEQAERLDLSDLLA